MKITWKYKFFDELDLKELYAILKLRTAVFIVEQNCAYADEDDRDQVSYHLFGTHAGKIAAYARIIPPGLVYEEASIGRVVTDPEYRRTGAGRELMKQAISRTLSQYKVLHIRIGAQRYLEAFYTSLGFKTTSAEYLEDGIPHVEMLYTK